MLSNLLIKNISKLDSELEEAFITDIKNSKSYIWITADGLSDGTIGFIKNKPDAGFFTAKLKRFQNIIKTVNKLYPTVNINNSYVTKLMPHYIMKTHIDKNRTTAILIPLGCNKGILTHSLYGIQINTHIYDGPTLARVDIPHSATNTSNEIRYALTLEVPGTFKENSKIYS